MTNPCTPEQSQALKEIGFDMPVYAYYSISAGLHINRNSNNFNKDERKTSAPTRSEVLQWAREKHKIHGWVASRTKDDGVTMFYPCGRTIPDTIINGRIVDIIPYVLYDTHPEAESALVWKIIEILKEKKEKKEKKG